MPRYSVLLPTHNRSDLLALSVASVLAQKEQDFEILVVGDGCTDDTGVVLERFGDRRIRFFDLPKGPGFGYANRNIALRQAKGDLIAFHSDDDLMFHDHLSNLGRLFRQERIMWAYSRPLWVRPDDVILPAYVNLRDPGARHGFMNVQNVIPAGCVMHRRQCFAENGYWPEEFDSSGDYEIWKRIIGQRPPGAIGVLRQPTQLHFKAAWREGDLMWPRFLAYVSAMADSTGFWPPGLRLETREGESQQAGGWRMLAQDPDRAAARMRSGCELLADRLAWTATQNPDFL